MITIFDNSMGNISSVANALQKLNVDFTISKHKKEIIKAKSIIFPGVGAFPHAVENLKKSSMLKILKQILVEKETPYLGICLGMQILFERSDEMKPTNGLGILQGSVKKIKKHKDFLVPHVGWNDFTVNKKNPLLRNINPSSKFYYDHSYYVKDNSSSGFASLKDDKKITVGVWSNNILGVQFHPEKSQTNGLKLLRNFINFSRDFKC